MRTFTYEEAHKIMTDYMEYKMSIRDHHGTSDAANDLRVLEAEGKNSTLPANKDTTNG